ncbi:MAG: FprA family A-type flavoprotein [Firmicutes bacterium]|nr:FprA family A-type flavoprotein [Bacillota bacterium]MCM1401337.1 FprA family A-type flavoprotein [Bacteroides sp.]MCM1477290.1 FprA family A-type flavoprotein [Bacteroides sp.]
MKLTDHIVSVGIDDASVRAFEAQYPTPHGMSYNSYVIVDKKIAVMDSVEAGEGDRWISNILYATSGREPDYLVVHHMEPDHSACIVQALDRFPNLIVVSSAQALKMLPQFFPDENFSSRLLTVREGDMLELGEHRLTFFAAPMIHWPEVMVSFEASTGTLFSADAFGKFGSLQYTDNWVSGARRYYTNIVGRYGAQVQTLLKKIGCLPIKRIASLHGPVLTEPLAPYIELYNKWSLYEPEERGVLVVYASIYGGTAAAAIQLSDHLHRLGVETVVTLDLARTDQSEAVAQAFRLSHLVLASPTYDSGLFPPMHDFIHHLGLKNFRNRSVGYIENGSWAPTAAKRMQALMATMPGIVDVDPVVSIRSRLNEESRGKLMQLAHALAESVEHDCETL